MIPQSVSIADVLRMLDIISDLGERDTSRHMLRTDDLCARLGRKLGMGEEKLASLSLACRLHDLGRVIGVSDMITNKPAQLNLSEMISMQMHPALACRILSPLGLPGEVMSAIFHHQENWDGSGYPQGLKGTDIPELARALHIADVYDAMVSERPYRRAFTHEEAINNLQLFHYWFDPHMLAAFLQLWE